ncbi:Ig-like domain-containing protein [Niabella terrae]
MRLRNLLITVLALICLAALALMDTGCANIVPPSGGPKDTLPPVIVGVDPPNETLHFDKKEIKILFDEYVELEDVYKNMVISPFPRLMPEVTRKLRTVTVKIKDSLQPNTTYVYNFANVIKDLNEGNRGKDLLYVFSTGNYFDSLELSGNVRMANTGKADSTLTVMLYSSMEDSVITKERPRYITRVDTSGTFFFRFLAPGTYRVYAMKDEGGSYLFNGEQVFAFADSPVVISPTPPPPVRLWAYQPARVRETDDEADEPDPKEKRLKLQSNLEGEQQDILKAFTISFLDPLKTFDTTKMRLSLDSNFTPAPEYHFSLDSTHKVITMNVPWQEDTLYNLILEKEFAADSLDRTIARQDTIRFRTRSRNDYGQAEIKFVDIDLDRHPVLLIGQGEAVRDAFAIPADRTIRLQLYNPGEYDMRILYDRNGNLQWDTGEFFKEHRQPELIDGISRKLVIKPNQWKTEFEVRMQ